MESKDYSFKSLVILEGDLTLLIVVEEENPEVPEKGPYFRGHVVIHL